MTLTVAPFGPFLLLALSACAQPVAPVAARRCVTRPDTVPLIVAERPYLEIVDHCE